MGTEILQQIALMLILLQFLNHFQEAIIPYFLLKYARKVKAAHPNSLILFSVLLLILKPSAALAWNCGAYLFY